MIKKTDIKPGVKVITRYSIEYWEVQGVNWGKKYPIVIKLKNRIESVGINDIKTIIKP